MKSMRVDEYFVIVEIFIFNIVGVFGNVQLLWTTTRKKSLQSKPGILLAINAACHIVCLLSEVINAAFLLSRTTVIRRTCFPFIIPYIFTISQQAIMTLAISLDLFIALLFPIWYRLRSTVPYISTIVVICSIYSLSILILGWITVNDDVIPFCNPPLGLAPKVSRYWSLSNVVISCLVVAVYVLIILFVHIRGKSKACQEHRKVVRRLKVIVIVFVFSWFMAMLGVDLGHAMGFSSQVLSVWQSNMVFFALLCYSQTFYVCIWRSLEYRAAFVEQLYLITCRKPDPRSQSIPLSITSKVFRIASRQAK